MAKEQEVFLDLLIAAMKDAAIERKLSQLATQIDPDGNGLRVVRIVVIPDELDFRLPTGKPLGSEQS